LINIIKFCCRCLFVIIIINIIHELYEFIYLDINKYIKYIYKMIDNLEHLQIEYEKIKQFSLGFYPELLMREQLIKYLQARNFNTFHISQIFRYWDTKLNEERNSFILPWPDQKYPSIINKEFTREIRSHSISWIAQVVYDFDFDKETFYIAVKIFDLYLQSNDIINKTDLCYITPAIILLYN